MNKGMTGIRMAMVVIGVLGLATATQATQYTWAGANGATWATADSWSPSSAYPASGDDAVFNTVSLTAVNVNANAAANSIAFSANTASLRLSNTSGGGNKTLTLGAGGLTNTTGNIYLGTTTANQGLNIILGASQTWTINATLTAYQNISGAGMALTKTGSSILSLYGANTFDGGLTIAAGAIYAQSSGCLGSGTVTLGDSSGATAANLTIRNNSSVIVPNNISLGTGSGTLTLQVSESATYSGTVTSLGTRDLTIAGFTGTNTISGTLNNQGTVTYTGTSSGSTITTLIVANLGANVTGLTVNPGQSGTSLQTLTLAGANTFGGPTKITKGTLYLTHTLALQNSYLDTANMIAGTAYSGLKTDQPALTFGGVTGTKDFSALFTTATGNGFSGLAGLTLNPGVSKSYSYSGTLADGAAGMTLTKTGAGTQTLTGTLSYSGATTVSNGVLDVSSATAFASTNWTIAALGTLKLGATNLAGKNLAVGVNGANAGLLDVTGNLTLGGNLIVTGSSTAPRKIAQTTGAISGTFSTTSLPSGCVLSIRNSDKELWVGRRFGTLVCVF